MSVFDMGKLQITEQRKQLETKTIFLSRREERKKKKARENKRNKEKYQQ